ncbi:MAG: METTL5 family protein [Candidatus Heimdallarchaeota archaeon]
MRVKRKDLEIFLQYLEIMPNLQIKYEQYPTSSRVAANLLWIAGIENDDIYQKNILDLGCGSGILALGAAYLGAKNVFGIDIDLNSISVARNNCKETDFEEVCNWICSDVRELKFKKVNTTIMNPPFGMRKESISRDRDFLITALQHSKVIYSINPHAEKTRQFFRKFCKEHGAEVVDILSMDFEIPRQYDFHKKNQHVIKIKLYHIKT